MSKETVEKMTTMENVTKKQMVEAIKANKKDMGASEQNTITVQTTIQDKTSEIIEKIESKIPKYVQLYSDLYKKYLQIANNMYIKSYLSQKEFYEKMELDDTRFTMFDTYLESIKKMVLLQIDISETMFQSYVGFRLTALDFYDQMLSGSMVNFANMCPILNSLKK
jgi:ABC-type antimicrobial peptide transport system permease subunit